jgi:hypothetical protein
MVMEKPFMDGGSSFVDGTELEEDEAGALMRDRRLPAVAVTGTGVVERTASSVPTLEP